MIENSIEIVISTNITCNMRNTNITWSPCNSTVVHVVKVTRKELYEKYKNLWQNLNDSKKLKYIKMAIEAKKKYDVRFVFVVFSADKT